MGDEHGMTLHKLAKGTDWMTPEEKPLARWFVSKMARQLRQRGVPETPLLVVRVNDAMVSFLLARRAESVLGFGINEDGTPLSPTPGAYDLVGKAHERLRRSVRELEDYCTRAGRPIDVGIADKLQPLMQATRALTEQLNP
ncbi:MAG: hypothetical protein GC168_13055 [Candidatus Hydrogenedens sp.]|nr:hypothetical protein [Candidatus Hydrogenedens sp.]